jgi:hypothetical protein
MPSMQGFLRVRRGPSDVDVRRHSSFAVDPTIKSQEDVVDARASEQLDRKTSNSSFLSPFNASLAVIEPPDNSLHRSISPPVQDETPKHRRFSMLKFRHASDTQLSTRARQEADAAAAPPVPGRKYPLPSW